MTIEPDIQLLSARQVIAAEQLHRYADPYEVIIQTQITAEEQVRAFAAEHGLIHGRLRVTWECRVEAEAVPA